MVEPNRLVQNPAEVGAKEDIVAENQADPIRSDEVSTYDKGLGNSLGFWLLGVFYI